MQPEENEFEAITDFNRISPHHNSSNNMHFESFRRASADLYMKKRKKLNSMRKRTTSSFSSFNELLEVDINNNAYLEIIEKKREKSTQSIKDLLQYLIKNVPCDPENCPENLIHINKMITLGLNNFLLEILKHHFLFSSIEDDLLQALILKMEYFKAKPNKYIFEKGDSSSYFFIIERGRLERRYKKQNGSEVSIILKKGDYFGDYTLLYNMSKSDEMRTLEPTFLWGLSKPVFTEVIKRITICKFHENYEFIKNLSYFKDMTNEQKEDLAYKVVIKKFRKESEILLNYLKFNSLYVIKEGEIQVSIGLTVIKLRKKGEYFGNFFPIKENYNIKVLSNYLECLEISHETFIEIFGSDFKTIIHANIKKEAVKNSKILKNLTHIQKEKILAHMTTISFQKDSIVKIEPDLTEKIFVVLEGDLLAADSSIKLVRGSVFGEEILINEQYKPNFSCFKVINNTSISFITKEDIESFLKMKYLNIIKVNENSHENLFSPNKLNLCIKKNPIDLLKLLIIKKIGDGHSGVVLLVKDQEKLYALKIISKGYVITQKLENFIRNEKKILWNLDFPFIIDLHKTFHDESNIFFLFEYIDGKSLHKVWLEQKKVFSLELAKFYTCSLILCLQYLHMKGIIHRDIKPENIMIDTDGYMKLIDFGMSKTFVDIETVMLKPKKKRFTITSTSFLDVEEEYKQDSIDQSDPTFESYAENTLNYKSYLTERTFTLCGTPHYTAPEVIKSKGYSFLIDYWSLGICLYQFLFGKLPFGENEDNPLEVFKEILSKHIHYPDFTSEYENAVLLIKQLLDKRPNRRLGSFQSFETLKNHKFLDDFNWDDLIMKKIKPSYVPQMKSNLEKEIVKAEAEGITFERLMKTTHMQAFYERSKEIKSSFLGWDEIFC